LAALIEDVTYEDVLITKPWWWAVWIGPQQQQEPHTALGDKCSLTYPFPNACPTQGCVRFHSVALRRVRVVEPLLAPGVVLGNASNPMANITFDSVVFDFGRRPLKGRFPWGRKYRCQHAQLRSMGGTTPVPECV
jgi:hypothetical protein